MPNVSQHISIPKDKLLEKLIKKPFDEVNLELANLKPDDFGELFVGTSVHNSTRKAPFAVTQILVCQNSYISGYAFRDTDNNEFKLTTSQLKQNLVENPDNFVNVSLNEYNQIDIINEDTIQYTEQFTQQEIDNIKSCARVLKIPVLINCYSYRFNVDGTVVVSLHEDFDDFTYYNARLSQVPFVLPTPLKYFEDKLISDMSNLFNGCQAKFLDLSNFDTSNIIDMSHMFEGSQANVVNVSNIDTSKVTDMSFMFSSCQANSLDLSKFDTSNTADMSFMFYSCQAKDLDLSSFNTQNTVDISKMFCGCQATNIDTTSFNTVNVTDMSRLFKSCQVTSLDLTNFDTSSVENMSSMFSGCLATSINLTSFDTSKVTNMSGMFYSCQAKTLDISNFDTSNVTYTDGMFDNFNNTLIK